MQYWLLYDNLVPSLYLHSYHFPVKLTLTKDQTLDLELMSTRSSVTVQLPLTWPQKKLTEIQGLL